MTSKIDPKIISMNVERMTTRQISYILMDIYAFVASMRFISGVINMPLLQTEKQQRRSFRGFYPITLFIDVIH